MTLFRNNRNATSKSSSRGMRAAATLALMATVAGGLLSSASPASANVAFDRCQHAGGHSTYINDELPDYRASGFELDFYLQRWSGSTWYYLGGSQSVLSTTTGKWIDAGGHYAITVGWFLSRGSGYYRLVEHARNRLTGAQSGYSIVSGYNDDLYGAQSWCYA